MFLKKKSLVEHPKRNQMATSQCPLGFILGRRTNVRHGLFILSYPVIVDDDGRVEQQKRNKFRFLKEKND